MGQRIVAGEEHGGRQEGAVVKGLEHGDVDPELDEQHKHGPDAGVEDQGGRGGAEALDVDANGAPLYALSVRVSNVAQKRRLAST